MLLIGLTSIQVNGTRWGAFGGALHPALRRYSQEAGSAICGVTAGCQWGGRAFYVITAYAFGGLAAGIFGQVRQFHRCRYCHQYRTPLLTMEFSKSTRYFEVFVASLW